MHILYGGLQFLVFGLVSFVAAAGDGLLMSKTADWLIVADGPQVLIQISDRFTPWIDDLDFFPIVCERRSDP